MSLLFLIFFTIFFIWFKQRIAGGQPSADATRDIVHLAKPLSPEDAGEDARPVAAVTIDDNRCCPVHSLIPFRKKPAILLMAHPLPFGACFLRVSSIVGNQQNEE